MATGDPGVVVGNAEPVAPPNSRQPWREPLCTGCRTSDCLPTFTAGRLSVSLSLDGLFRMPDESASDRREFIREQYAQYFETYRQHVSLAWQLPAVAIGGFVAASAIDASAFKPGEKGSFPVALSFVVLGLFIWLLAFHNQRNYFYLCHYSRLLERLESEHGLSVLALHLRAKEGLGKWRHLSSTRLLTLFPVVLGAASLGMGLLLLLTAV